MASTCRLPTGAADCRRLRDEGLRPLLHEAIANELRGPGLTVTAFCPGPTAPGFLWRPAMEDSRLVRGRAIMDARTVAEAGSAGMPEGKTVVIAGRRNWLMTDAIRFPRAP